jgi:hypothetical protein
VEDQAIASALVERVGNSASLQSLPTAREASSLLMESVPIKVSENSGLVEDQVITETPATPEPSTIEESVPFPVAEGSVPAQPICDESIGESVPIEGLTVTILAEDREIVEPILEKVVNEDGQTAIADLTEAIIDSGVLEPSIIAESVPLETRVGADVGEEPVPSELISEDVAGEPQSVSTDAPVYSAVPEEPVKDKSIG